MDNNLHKRMVQKAVRGKFRSIRAIPAKYSPIYPGAAERELKRLTRAYLKLLAKEVKASMPEIASVYRTNAKEDVRFDDLADFRKALKRIFGGVAQSIETSAAAYELRKRVRRIADITKKSALREWVRSVRKTLGINLLDDYYKGDFYESAIEQWVSGYVAKIETIPSRELGEMERIITEGYMNGKPLTTVAEEIQNEYNVTESKAMFLARDQLGSLNCQITRLQQEDAGVRRYMWSDSQDERVRECHSALNGEIFRWDDPPEMWTSSKKGITLTGRRCNPGEDYGCRCCAIPVFDFDTLDLPMKGVDENESTEGTVPGFPLSTISFAETGVAP